MDVFSGKHIDCVLDARANVLLIKVGIVISNDLVKGNSLADQFQDALYWDTSARDTGLAEMNSGVDGDSLVHTPIISCRATPSHERCVAPSFAAGAEGTWVHEEQANGGQWCSDVHQSILQ